ncbi:MAG: TraB/GumN family protein [Thermotogota bacterium]
MENETTNAIKNVHRIDYQGKELILLGTAHVSKQSAQQVRELIEEEKPDTVCVELDKGRYDSIVDKNRWEKMDIIKIVKSKQSAFLLVNLALSSYQKRIAEQFGINAGAEMIEGVNAAKDIDAKLVLADRDIKTTFLRIWRGMKFWGKMKLLVMIIASIFSKEEITEEELEKMKSEDMLTATLSELSDTFPELKKSLIDERDQYLAYKIKNAPGQKILAVLGAGHIPGIKQEIEKEQDMAKITRIPRASNIWKVFLWAIPVIIVALIVSTFFLNPPSGWAQIVSWILWNGSLSALGALAALAHPLSILTAFAIAPITSLNPLLAAGWFAGLVEALIRKPSVKDFETLSEDVMSFKGFWKNKVTKVLLVVILANVGSTIGTLVGGAEVLRLFLQSL